MEGGNYRAEEGERAYACADDAAASSTSVCACVTVHICTTAECACALAVKELCAIQSVNE